MATKFIVLAAFVAVTRAGHLGLGYAATPAVVGHGSHDAISTYSTVQHHAPSVHSYAAHAPLVHAPVAHAYAAPVAHAYAAPVVHAEPSAPAHYDFGYAVSDPHTGDSKSQQESRRGDVVHGSYSLLESDGTKRTVDYTADAHNGFNAVVHKEPVAVHGVAKLVAPVAHAAPLVHSAQVAHGYSAPLAVAHAGPVAHGYSAPLNVAHAGSVVHGYSAPLAVAHAGPVAHGYSAPLTVAHAGSVAHGYSAPLTVGHAVPVAHGYGASVAHQGYAAPLAHGVAHGYSAHSPIVSHSLW